MILEKCEDCGGAIHWQEPIPEETLICECDDGFGDGGDFSNYIDELEYD